MKTVTIKTYRQLYVIYQMASLCVILSDSEDHFSYIVGFLNPIYLNVAYITYDAPVDE